MNLGVLGLFSFNIFGLQGFVVLMLSHGLTSSALFFLIGFIYKKFGVRLLGYYGGLVRVSPLFTIFFFFFSLANMGFVGTFNFVGEYLCFLGIVHYSLFVVFLALTNTVLGSVYSIFLFNKVCFGSFKYVY